MSKADSALKVISLRFSEDDYAKLKTEADSLGLKPAVLARVLVRTGLNTPQERPPRHSYRQFKTALDRLDRLVAAGNPTTADPVELIRRGRDQRDADMAAALAVRPPS